MLRLAGHTNFKLSLYCKLVSTTDMLCLTERCAPFLRKRPVKASLAGVWEIGVPFRSTVVPVPEARSTFGVVQKRQCEAPV